MLHTVTSNDGHGHNGHNVGKNAKAEMSVTLKKVIQERRDI